MRRHGTITGRLLLGCVLLLALPGGALGQVLFSCVRPLALQDRWEEVQTPPWDPADTFDAVSPIGDPLPAPDLYRAPDDPAPTGYDPLIHGVPVGLRLGSPVGALPGSSWFPVAWDSACTGGDCYREVIRSCSDIPLALSSVIGLVDTEPGNMIGPTRQGFSELIARDPSAYWDTTIDDGHGGVAGSAFPVSPRIITLVLFDPYRYALAQVSGRIELGVVGFAGFFVTGMASATVNGYWVTRFRVRAEDVTGIHGSDVSLAAEVLVGSSRVEGLEVEFLIDGAAARSTQSENGTTHTSLGCPSRSSMTSTSPNIRTV